ncbi:MAG: hypothetical protein Q7S92_05875 [Candidatus Diapherotrites archaeon]|nr:hypothetical protein [Candidatus Diapherotrites archaeon]
MTVVGLFQELEDDEKLLQESSDICQLYSKTGMGFWSWVGREKPDTSFAKVYLTNKHLIFLSLFTGNLQELKSGKGEITGLAVNWIKLPLNTITKLETPAKIGFGDVLASAFGQKEDKKAEMVIHVKSISRQVQSKGLTGALFGPEAQIFSVIIDKRDAWAATIENAIHGHKKATKTGPSVDDSFRVICDCCGTHYNEDDVKMVQCLSCSKYVCKEKKEGSVFKKWVESNCFNTEKFVCIACSKK